MSIVLQGTLYKSDKNFSRLRFFRRAKRNSVLSRRLRLYIPSHLTVNGVTYDRNVDIANLFNINIQYLQISPLMLKLDPVESPPDWNFLHEFIRSKLPHNESFVIPPITSFVLDSLSQLSTRKAVGLDGVNGYCLKISAPSIASSLTTIFNLSSNTFPDMWKSQYLLLS